MGRGEPHQGVWRVISICRCTICFKLLLKVVSNITNKKVISPLLFFAKNFTFPVSSLTIFSYLRTFRTKNLPSNQLYQFSFIIKINYPFKNPSVIHNRIQSETKGKLSQFIGKPLSKGTEVSITLLNRQYSICICLTHTGVWKRTIGTVGNSGTHQRWPEIIMMEP